MGEQMVFPETFDEFAEQYKLVDTKQVYTNGTELIPVFRVRQWLMRPDPLAHNIKTATAEIEKLKETIEYKDICIEACEEAKSEAVKECLVKVKNYIKTHCNPYGKPDFDYDTSIKILNFIDNL